MSKYATITITRKVKKILEKEKENRNWSEFLLFIYEEYKRLKMKESFEKLRNLLSDEDLKEIERSYKEFRRNFRLR
ncbi:MAG: antitoxin VapB family protein [Candidatus Asgardarchaeia archaeon]